ncbi:MAG: hypothetical protein LC624_08750 [Halobacteriales archaeon]|nr:hypothetical protein [Halobacteriales archaeon]
MDVCPTCGEHLQAGEGLTLRVGERGGRFCSLQCGVSGVGLMCDHCACPILGKAVRTQRGLYCCHACAGHGARVPALEAKRDAGLAMANPPGSGRAL